MAAAGRTQGGFYRHFESKDQLVAETCRLSMESLVSAAKAAMTLGDKEFLNHLKRFVSSVHCEDWSNGCPIVFMGSELARSDAAARHAVSQGFRELIEVVADFDRSKQLADARSRSIFALSAMIGAVTIARIVDDPALSASVLKETAKHLMAQLKKEPAKRQLLRRQVSKVK